MPALLITALLHLAGQKPPATIPPPTPKVAVVDLTKGTGESVQFGDKVTLDYTGYLTNGKKFDSSKGPGRTPFTVVVGIGQVIKGWDQGLLGMQVGGIRKLTIPFQLAYGEAGNPPDIPAKATLIFTVALHKIDHALSRVKVEITKAGHGPALDVGQVAKMIYTARLTSGKYIISKKELPEPTSVLYGSTYMVPGLALGIYGMKAGETRTVTVPPDLAFGDHAPESIGPNQAIIFEVTLFSIEPPRDESGGPDKRS